MMKKITKIIALVVSLLMVIPAVACGNNTKKAENEIEIQYYRGGMGIEWLERLAESFEKTHPGYKVSIVDSAQDVGRNLDCDDPTIMTGDLLIGSMSFFLAYRQYLEPLNSILDKKVYNGNMTLGEKVDTNLMRTMTYEDKVYALNWANIPTGLFYNKSLFDSMEYRLPRTTDELASLGQTIVDDRYQNSIKIDGKPITNIYGDSVKTYPFIHFNKEGDYYYFIDRVWQAQYDGIDQYYASENASWIDPESGETIFPHINFAFTQGRYEAKKALEKIVAPAEYTYEYSNSVDHTSAQTHFLNGEAAIMANASWLENEMRSTNIPFEFSVMKTPILSAVGTKLNISEAQLCAIVDYVDSADYLKNTVNDNSTEYSANTIKDIKALDASHKDIYGKSKTGAEIIDEIYEDRNLIYNNGCGMRVVMPNYSLKKEQAAEFLLYMYSDEGLKIMVESTKTPAPAKMENDSNIDMSKWTKFSQNVYNFAKGKTNLIKLYNSKLFISNNLITGPSVIVSYARRLTDVQPATVEDLWKEDISTIKGRWRDALEMANLPVVNGDITVQFYGRENVK